MSEASLFDQTTASTLLNRLDATTSPLWGMMSAQHMIEHLAQVVRFSNGKETVELAIPPEKVERARARLLSPEWRMPREFKASFLPAEGLPALKHADLNAAKTALFSEMDDFYSFFAKNPGVTPNHAYFGELNLEQWEVLHHKHFKHHFEQFGLIPGLDQ